MKTRRYKPAYISAKILTLVLTAMMATSIMVSMPQARAPMRVGWKGWYFEGVEVTEVAKGDVVTAKAWIEDIVSGTYRVRIMRERSVGSNVEVVSKYFIHSGGYRMFNVDFVASHATGEDHTVGYYVDIYDSADEVWTMSLPYPPKLRVRSLSGVLIWKKISNLSSSTDLAKGVAIDGTGVYVVGYDKRLGAGDPRWRMEKRNLTDGSCIWIQTENPSNGYDAAFGVAVDDTGVYVVGHDSRLGTEDTRWRLEKRSLTTGSRLWAKKSNPSSDSDVAYGLAVYGTGVYIVGRDAYFGDWRWRIEKRSTTDGSLIWKNSDNPSNSNDEATCVAVDGSGVYIVGYDSEPGNSRWRMEKRNLTDGSRIWVKTINPSSSADRAYGVAVDGTGVYVVGYDNALGAMRWRMEKRSKIDGSLIWTKTSSPSIYSDKAYGVAVDGTGVYIVGYDRCPGSGGRWRMEKRRLTDGDLVWSKISNPSSYTDEAWDVAVDGTGVYVVGNDVQPSPINWGWRMEKRHL